MTFEGMLTQAAGASPAIFEGGGEIRNSLCRLLDWHVFSQGADMTRTTLACVLALLFSATGFVQIAGAQQQAADPTRRAALISIARPADADDAIWQREIATHATLLVHDATFVAALADEKASIRTSQWFANHADPAAAAQWLRAHVRAEPVPGTRLIRVYLDASPGTPADEVAILESIVNAYIIEQAKSVQSGR